MSSFTVKREELCQSVVEQVKKRRTVNTDYLSDIGAADVRTLLDKDKQYGSSWKKRGGVGAFMMVARKWDRLETLLTGPKYRYDIFEALLGDSRAEGVIDDIRDLRAYLLLIESEMVARNAIPAPKAIAVIDADQYMVPADGIPKA